MHKFIKVCCIKNTTKQEVLKEMDEKISIEALMGMTIGQVAALTQQYLKEKPSFKTAQQILEEREK